MLRKTKSKVVLTISTIRHDKKKFVYRFGKDLWCDRWGEGTIILQKKILSDSEQNFAGKIQ